MNAADLASIQPLLIAVRTIEMRTITAEIAAIVKSYVPECDAVLLERNNAGDWSLDNLIVGGHPTLPDTWMNTEDERVWAAEQAIRPLLTDRLARSTDPITLGVVNAWEGTNGRSFTSRHLIHCNTAAADSAAVLAADAAIAALTAFKASLAESTR